MLFKEVMSQVDRWADEGRDLFRSAERVACYTKLRVEEMQKRSAIFVLLHILGVLTYRAVRNHPAARSITLDPKMQKILRKIGAIEEEIKKLQSKEKKFAPKKAAAAGKRRRKKTARRASRS